MEKKYAIDFSQIKFSVKLNVRSNDGLGCYGPGVNAVLKAIQRTNSVKGASKETGISYGKIWKLLDRLEEGTGVKIVDRIQGGTHGGSAQITKAGEELIAIYDDLEKKLHDHLQSEIQNLFDNI